MTSIAHAANTPHAGRRIASIFPPFAAGYFLSYAFRTINGAAADDLIAAFDLGPGALGLLTSVYFLTFAACQIPVGVLIDRFGPRRVQSVLLLVAGLGAFVFASAASPSVLILGRALIGLGCSGAMVTGVKAMALWLPPRRRAAGNAALVMCGGLGAMASSTPLGAGPHGLDWRIVFDGLGGAALLVGALVWLLVPDTTSAGGATLRQLYAGLVRVIARRDFWRVAPLSASVVGAAFSFHGLWAARWLADVAGMAAADVATVLLAMGAALTLGAAGFGALATGLRRRGVTTPQVFGAACMVLLATEAVLASDTPLPPILTLAVFASFGAITVLSYTMIGELFPTELVGRANGVLNTLHLGAAFAMQAGIGAVVALWPFQPGPFQPGPIQPGPMQPGGHVPAIAYAVAIGMIMTLQVAAWVWFAAPAKLARRPILSSAA